MRYTLVNLIRESRKMKMTESIIKSFEEPSNSRIMKLTKNTKVAVKSGHENFQGVITSPPFFSVDHATNYPDSPNCIGGTWWLMVDGKRYSLMDYNVIPNSYNDHSITVVKGLSND